MRQSVMLLFALAAGLTLSGIAANLYRLLARKPGSSRPRSGSIYFGCDDAWPSPSVLDSTPRNLFVAKPVRPTPPMLFAVTLTACWSFALGPGRRHSFVLQSKRGDLWPTSSPTCTYIVSIMKGAIQRSPRPFELRARVSMLATRGWRTMSAFAQSHPLEHPPAFSSLVAISPQARYTRQKIGLIRITGQHHGRTPAQPCQQHLYLGFA